MTIFGWRLIKAKEADWCIKRLNESEMQVVYSGFGKKVFIPDFGSGGVRVSVHCNVVQRSIDCLCGKP